MRLLNSGRLQPFAQIVYNKRMAESDKHASLLQVGLYELAVVKCSISEVCELINCLFCDKSSLEKTEGPISD
jgi:hypothetical protein